MEIVRNYWPDSKCAKAFWGQHDLPAYRELLQDTEAWLDPQAGERWLDLGCGAGRLTRSIWVKSGGKVEEVIGVDCAAVNARAYEELRRTLRPAPAQRIRFLAGDFSSGLPAWDDASFDGVVSGLAIQYAESYSDTLEQWTSQGYDQVLREVRRVLRPGGRFVFSVNVPEPSWLRVAFGSPLGLFRSARPLSYLKRGWRMWSYGGWLKREARRGRFHYLPLPAILDKLHRAGFSSIEHRLSFARQALLLRCQVGPE